jgi:hypothetical protein
MIIIRHQTGPLGGTEQKIEPKSDRITFGRDSQVCDVVYPPDEILVARRHFALVKKLSGEWTFDLFGDLFIAMDGQPVYEAQALRDGAKIELGRHGGPSFEVRISGETLASELPATGTQEEVEGPHAIALRAERAAARTRRFALAGVVLAIIASSAAAGIYYLVRSEGGRLSEAVTALSKEQERMAGQAISDTAKHKLVQAAYVVLKKFPNGRISAFGTATPIATNLLATNAHIAQRFLEKQPDERVYVRAPGHDGAVYEVVEARKHPAYGALADFLRSDPIVVWENCPKCVPDFLSSSNAFSYDVGTLRVSDGQNLSPIIEIAGREELAKLEAGSPLAAVGYPMEGVAGTEVQPLAPQPTLATGIITAMTDMFNVASDVDHRFLIRNNLPGAGGSSGSAMIGPSGKIVGFFNAGTTVPVPESISPSERIDSAVMINYGQRADLLLDLLADSGSTNIDLQRAYWKKMTETFKRGIEVIVPHIVEAMKPKAGMSAELVSRGKFSMTAEDKTVLRDSNGKDVTVRLQKRFLNVTAGRPYVFICYAEQATNMNLYLYVGGKLVDKDAGRSWYPFRSYMAKEDGAIELKLLSIDKDVTYTLFQYVYGGG